MRCAHQIFPVASHAHQNAITARACREHRRKLQRRTILLGAHGAPYRRWSRVAGVCCLSARRFRPHGWRGCGSASAATLRGRRVGPSLLPFGDGVWWAGGGRLSGVRAVVPAGQSLADGSAPFFTRFASKAAEGLFAQNKHAGRGGRPPPSRRSRPDPVASSRQPIIPWKNEGPPFTMTPFPPCFVSAPPLCRKASLST